MKAIRIHSAGGPEVLQLEEVEKPEPGPGEIRVRIARSGVNFIDIYHRIGLYPMPLPFTPGQEAAGVVDALGSGVSEVKIGQRVAYASITGSYAEYSVIPAEKAIPVPDSVTDDVAAAIPLQGMTAHYLAHSTFVLEKGSRCLVHAAAGGVGLLLVQMAKKAGAVVFGTVSTDEKEALARNAGADHIIRYTQASVVDEVKRLTEGSGLDVVYDSVGKTTFHDSMKCLRPRGTLVSFGQSSGAIPPFDVVTLSRAGSLYLTRPTLVHYTLTREELLWRANDCFSMIAAGQLDVRIDSTFPLESAGMAQERLASRKSAGKILIEP